MAGLVERSNWGVNNTAWNSGNQPPIKIHLTTNTLSRHLPTLSTQRQENISASLTALLRGFDMLYSFRIYVAFFKFILQLFHLLPLISSFFYYSLSFLTYNFFFLISFFLHLFVHHLIHSFFFSLFSLFLLIHFSFFRSFLLSFSLNSFFSFFSINHVAIFIHRFFFCRID